MNFVKNNVIIITKKWIKQEGLSCFLILIIKDGGEYMAVKNKKISDCIAEVFMYYQWLRPCLYILVMLRKQMLQLGVE